MILIISIFGQFVADVLNLFGIEWIGELWGA